MGAAAVDWDPEIYARFRGLRLRPALDLLAQVPALPAGPAVDLGCGNGAVARALATRFPDRALIGVDSSRAMLAEAEAEATYTDLVLAGIDGWSPVEAPALIFSNAALHWLPDHAALLPRLAGVLAPGGTLAVQMPSQSAAPSHRLLREIAAAMFPQKFDFTGWQPPVLAAEGYWRMLSPLGRVMAWETEYIQRLEPSEAGHPVRRFTESTAMRPFVEGLSAEQAAAFVAAYDAALEGAYPRLEDGGVLFPFRRCFFTLTL